jgi:type III pantothenate kinase
MLITFDIGNTNIKSAVFENHSPGEFTIHPTIGSVFLYLQKADFKKAAICSVNPSTEQKLTDYLFEKGIPVFNANMRNKLNLEIKYKTPETLGMDRVCSAAGALEMAILQRLLENNQYLITVDFGTATTINIVSPSGEFIGGLIAPGLSTMLKSLNEETARLPIPDLNSYCGLIGYSTETSMLSGVVSATIGMINETINELTGAGRHYKPIVFATGGNAGFILPHLKHKVFFERALVLKGLKVIYDLNSV